jgi:cold shock CspA family protein
MVQPDQGIRLHSTTGGGKVLFVHISAVEKAGLSTLNEATVK